MGSLDPDKFSEDWNRQLASHQNPLIGLYDSNDSDLLECHVLLMKIAGVDGVIIDWYGTESFRDYAKIHRNSLHLVEFLKRAGLKFAVCYEDQTVKHMIANERLAEADEIQHGVKVLNWLAEHWFSDESYVYWNDRPVLLVFGPQHFKKKQWRELVESSRTKPLTLGLPHLTESHGMDGSFGWPPVSGGKKVQSEEWRRYIGRLNEKSKNGTPIVSIVFPAFHDYYSEAGLHESYGSIESRSGQTFTETLQLSLSGHSPIVQIATWNDYGEGTVIEPTHEFGYRYLEEIQENTASRNLYKTNDLRLPIQLYQLRKRELNPMQERTLNQASEHLFEGECERARVLLKDLIEAREESD